MPAATLVHDPALAEQRAYILRALANPVRLRIMAYLVAVPAPTVGRICDELDLPQARVSQQLSALRACGLVQLRKEGGFHHYSLAIPAVQDLLACLGRCGRVQPEPPAGRSGTAAPRPRAAAAQKARPAGRHRG